MLTYDLSKIKGPLYEGIYTYIKEDIQKSRLKADEKMPSKRALAKNLGVSIITIENAYDQLIGEGYLYTLPRKGYYVSRIENLSKFQATSTLSLDIHYPKPSKATINLSNNHIDSDDFPFSVWARLMRETISTKENALIKNSTCGGVYELRQAIANHLASFRGMNVDPDQIVIGAGTEYLYGVLIQLLGAEKTVCLENPGYKKIAQIYQSHHVNCTYANLDASGISMEEIRASGAEVVHISPTHHFPTGITMPIKRRYELLSWANEKEKRMIIEDDYDSEFRLNGKPIPPLQTIDTSGKVIYVNTFSKSLAPTIRISYMVLPRNLANLYYEKLAFYTCTVSTFEQYTLASFIEEGYFEKHINRMRLAYGRRRKQMIECMKRHLDSKEYDLIENDSGLHFILCIHSKKSDDAFVQELEERGIHLSAIKDYFFDERKDTHQFLLNYASVHPEQMNEIFQIMHEVI